LPPEGTITRVDSAPGLESGVTGREKTSLEIQRVRHGDEAPESSCFFAATRGFLGSVGHSRQLRAWTDVSRMTEPFFPPEHSVKKGLRPRWRSAKLR